MTEAAEWFKTITYKKPDMKCRARLQTVPKTINVPGFRSCFHVRKKMRKSFLTCGKGLREISPDTLRITYRFHGSKNKKTR